MIGQLVPIVLMPRFTSYVGAGTYTTEQIDVEAYATAVLTFWRGKLVGGATTDPFATVFEESQDGDSWTRTFPGAITDADTVNTYPMQFTKKWFRARTVLAADSNGLVGISLWAAGVLERRIAPS